MKACHGMPGSPLFDSRRGCWFYQDPPPAAGSTRCRPQSTTERTGLHSRESRAGSAESRVASRLLAPTPPSFSVPGSGPGAASTEWVPLRQPRSILSALIVTAGPQPDTARWCSSAHSLQYIYMSTAKVGRPSVRPKALKHPLERVDLGYRPLQQMAYERLREDILRGRYEPGDRLRIAAIAARYGISPVPVREALRSLDAEGLVDFTPNRGASIPRLTAEELEEIFSMRIPLESLALRRAIPNLTSGDLQRLDDTAALMRERKDEPARWLDLNQRFHLEMYKRAGLPRLNQVLTNLWGLVRPYLGVYMARTQTLTKAHAEHDEILRACRTRDIPRAVYVLEEHLMDTARIVGAALSSGSGRETPTSSGRGEK